MAIDVQESRELKERVVEINRVAKVVKGGRRFSFTALVVVGDEVDRVGVGYGKAREVPLAISKAVDDARKNLFTVPKHGATITHESLGTTNPINMLKAAEQALRQLRRPEEVAKARGKQISEVLPYKAPEAVEDHDVSDPGITLAESDSTDQATESVAESDSTDQVTESDLAATNQIPAVPAEAEEVTATDGEAEADAGA